METIYIVSEDSHGDVSYWNTENGARNEVMSIVNNMYLDPDDEPIEQYNRIMDESWDTVVYYREVRLNVPFG